MGLKNCPECGKLFVDNASGMCPACYEQEEKDESLVAEFLRDASKASIQEIHEATGVKERVILRMIKGGRVMGDFEVTYPCETCGALISEGRVCHSCSKNIMGQLPADSWKPKQTTTSERNHGRMYTNDKYNK